MNFHDGHFPTQFLTFNLNNEQYAFSIAQVREVLDYVKITKVPRTPEFMRGVINLRGGVVPVIDMRTKFGMEQVERTKDTCIIIVEVEVDEVKTIIGALADSVKEVLELDSADIEPAPKLGTRLKTEFIQGMGKRNEEFIIILDIDKIFSTDELSLLNEASENETLTAISESAEAEMA